VQKKKKKKQAASFVGRTAWSYDERVAVGPAALHHAPMLDNLTLRGFAKLMPSTEPQKPLQLKAHLAALINHACLL
jgi:hypothetical protein